MIPVPPTRKTLIGSMAWSTGNGIFIFVSAKVGCQCVVCPRLSAENALLGRYRQLSLKECAEQKTYQWTAKKDLPAKCHRKVAGEGLKPDGGELSSCMTEN